jgi:hypothetical protein
MNDYWNANCASVTHSARPEENTAIYHLDGARLTSIPCRVAQSEIYYGTL